MIEVQDKKVEAHQQRVELANKHLEDHQRKLNVEALKNKEQQAQINKNVETLEKHEKIIRKMAYDFAEGAQERAKQGLSNIKKGNAELASTQKTARKESTLLSRENVRQKQGIDEEGNKSTNLENKEKALLVKVKQQGQEVASEDQVTSKQA